MLWGFITRYLNTIASPGFDFVPVLLGAVLFWDFFTRVMHGVTMAFLEDVWSRNFLNLFASPLSIGEYVGGLVLSCVATSVLGLLTMVVLATTAFGLSFFAYGVMLVPFLLVLFLFGIALGIFASALVLRFGPASEWIVWPVPAFLSPFAGDLLPGIDAPALDAAGLLPPSSVVRVRGNARDRLGGSLPGNRASLQRLSRRAVHPPGIVVFRPRPPARGAHGTSRPLQRGKRKLEKGRRGGSGGNGRMGHGIGGTVRLFDGTHRIALAQIPRKREYLSMNESSNGN